MYQANRSARFAATDRSHRDCAPPCGSGHRPRRGRRGASGKPQRLFRGHGPLPQRLRSPLWERSSAAKGAPRCTRQTAAPVSRPRTAPTETATTPCGSGHRPRRGHRGVSGKPQRPFRGHGPLPQRLRSPLWERSVAAKGAPRCTRQTAAPVSRPRTALTGTATTSCGSDHRPLRALR